MDTPNKILSIIVPCYNEEESVPLFYAETIKQERFFHDKGVEFEFIFVNDGSRDKTVEQVKLLHEKDERVHLVSFSRNFGKEAAIVAGFEKARGDIVVLMDADLQDPPALLPEMYGHIESGYDSVATRRVDRKGEPPIRSWFARRFYGLMRKISKTDIVDGARDYRMMTRQVVDAILSMREYNRFSKGIFGWVGFDTKWLEYENIQRAAGETKWSFWKLFLYSLDGIMAFSTVPLSIASFLGILFCIIAFAFLIFIFIRALVFGDNVAGWPSTICVITLLGGLQLLCLGIMGQYLSKLYLEVKDRPKYLVKEEF
ncbi:MAG: glycosyltransferase family 2 protein [Oscillospiraceae bacterium]|nr:glycosyltransferase family 2 protein [Oscillospiraceae bacterium]